MGKFSIFFLILSALSFGSMALADNSEKEHSGSSADLKQNLESTIQRMKEELNLTSTQIEKLKEIKARLSDYIPKQRALIKVEREKLNKLILSPERSDEVNQKIQFQYEKMITMHRKLYDWSMSRYLEIRDILSPEQFKKMEQEKLYRSF